MANFKEKIGVVDLFCGIGGLSHGMKRKGFDILGGFDIDKSCKYAYETNNEAKFFTQDVATISGLHIDGLFADSQIKVLVGCAPCQPFSSYAFKYKEKDSTKYNLLYQFARLIEESSPDIVTMENVSQITGFKLSPVLDDFVQRLTDLSYHVSYKIVYCPDYGIPQTRKRLVLLASKLGEINLIEPTHSPKDYITVRQAIGHLPILAAGETDKEDSLHRARALNEINLQRIKASIIGKTWKDWPEELKLECHKKDSGKSFKGVYGRMDWDKPAPTMTTLCMGLGNGKFGHPEQDRAISAREAAIFQTFPDTYQFFAPEQEISSTKAARYIGNAVPPLLGEITAQSIINHLLNHDKLHSKIKSQCAEPLGVQPV